MNITMFVPRVEAFLSLLEAFLTGWAMTGSARKSGDVQVEEWEGEVGREEFCDGEFDGDGEREAEGEGEIDGVGEGDGAVEVEGDISVEGSPASTIESRLKKRYIKADANGL